MRHPVFGIHTGIFKHQITKKECYAVKAFFGKQPDETLSEEMFFFDKGITKIWLQEISGRYAKYYLYVKINFSRVLGISGHKVMPYTIPNVKKAIRAVDRVLKKLPLLEKNSDFSEWTAERTDTAFDIYEEYPALLMWLLNHSLNLGNRTKKCERIQICADGKPPEQIMCESMRFGNNSYVYNVYAKLPEVIARARAKGTSATPEDLAEVQNLVRIERQNLANGCKKLLLDGKAGDIAKDSVRKDILKTIIDEMALFFGKGDFYSWDGIQKKYFPEHEAEIRSVLDVMVQITKTSLEESQEAFTKEAADIFERLGLAPVGIPPGKHSIDSIQGVYSRIVAEYPRPPNKRPYSDFPKPHKTGDGRYKATVTLYQADGTRKQLPVAGRSVADYEQKVLAKLTDVYLRNRIYTAKNSGTARPDCCQKSADSLIRFHKAAKTQSVKKDAEQFIKALKLDIKKPEVHNINGLPSGINSSRAVTDKPAQLLESNV